MNILNTARAIKRMSANEIRYFILETIINKLDFPNKNLLFNETLQKKKDLLLLAIKLIEKIPDPCNAEKSYQPNKHF